MPKFNDLVTAIAEHEDMKSQSSVGDIREQLRITLILLASLSIFELAELLKKYVGKDLK